MRRLQVKLIKIGGWLVQHAQRLVFQLTELALPWEVFQEVLTRPEVAGYVLKTALATELEKAFGDVAEGRLVFEPAVADKVMSPLRQDDARTQLRARSSGTLTALEHV